MRIPTLVTALLLLSACPETDDSKDVEGVDTATVDTGPSDPDADGDGTPASEDCDDTNAEISPGADEVCDGIDNDCDGAIDAEDDSVLDAGTWFTDVDGDGYGDAANPVISCEEPVGHVNNDGDCDDTNAAFHPGASEADCADPADYNCDGSVGYADADGDGYAACEDCNDEDAAVNEDGVEICNGLDDDCNGFSDSEDPGLTDGSTWYGDSDGDGYGGTQYTETACEQPDGFVDNTDDCDDLEPATYPGASEVCDGEDNDCDTQVDEGVQTTWYADADGDGYGDSATTTEACQLPPGFTSNGDDCDDAVATSNPAAWEICDGADNNCDGDIDESASIDTDTFYLDNDNDGYGVASSTQEACSAPSGYATNAGDCNDSDAAVNPVADEICDSVDNDCDGTTDEASALDAGTWYSDGDGDGYGTATSSTVACDSPSGHVADNTDCNDSDGSISPGATESCDSIDNDCDGDIDENDSVDASTWYADADGDTFGDLNNTSQSCNQPSGHVADATDCDDTPGSGAAINPSATESCDTIDNNCDGTIDEAGASGGTTFYADSDADGAGDLNSTTLACSAPSGFVSDSSDCDDANASSASCDSCLSWQTFNDSGDGIYNIDPAGTGGFDVYCNMSEDNGGWTLLFTATADHTNYGSGFDGWYGTGDTSAITSPTDTGKSEAYDTVAFDEIRLTAFNGSVIIATTDQTYSNMPTLVGPEITTCSGLNGTPRHQFTADSRIPGHWENDYIGIVACDTDGDDLESDGTHYDAAVFTTNLNNADYNYSKGDLGSEFRVGGITGDSSSSSSNRLSLWVR